MEEIRTKIKTYLKLNCHIMNSDSDLIAFNLENIISNDAEIKKIIDYLEKDFVSRLSVDEKKIKDAIKQIFIINVLRSNYNLKLTDEELDRVIKKLEPKSLEEFVVVSHISDESNFTGMPCEASLKSSSAMIKKSNRGIGIVVQPVEHFKTEKVNSNDNPITDAKISDASSTAFPQEIAVVLKKETAEENIINHKKRKHDEMDIFEDRVDRIFNILFDTTKVSNQQDRDKLFIEKESIKKDFFNLESVFQEKLVLFFEKVIAAPSSYKVTDDKMNDIKSYLIQIINNASHGNEENDEFQNHINSYIHRFMQNSKVEKKRPRILQPEKKLVPKKESYQISDTYSLDIFKMEINKKLNEFKAESDIKKIKNNLLDFFNTNITRLELSDLKTLLEEMNNIQTEKEVKGYDALVKVREERHRWGYGNTTTWQKMFHSVKDTIIDKVRNGKSDNDESYRTLLSYHSGRWGTRFGKTNSEKRFDREITLSKAKRACK